MGLAGIGSFRVYNLLRRSTVYREHSDAMAMQLPDVHNAVISAAKIVDYLLNPLHPDGGGKAKFFLAVGFQVTRWQELADAIRDLVMRSEVTRQLDSVHGRKYIVEGPIQAPNGGQYIIRTVWIADGKPTSRLTTAYPIQPLKRHD